MSDETIDLTYVGRRLTAKHALVYAWLDPDGEERWYKRQLVSFAGIGTTYRFERGEGTFVVTNSNIARVGREEDESKRMAWEALSTSQTRDYEGVQQAKREKDQSLIRDAMLPIRVAMAKHRQVARASVFGDAVMQELHRPLTKAEREEAGL